MNILLGSRITELINKGKIDVQKLQKACLHFKDKESFRFITIDGEILEIEKDCKGTIKLKEESPLIGVIEQISRLDKEFEILQERMGMKE